MQEPDVIPLAHARIERRRVEAGTNLIIAPQPGSVALHAFTAGTAVADRSGTHHFGPGSAAFATAALPHIFRCTASAESTVFFFARDRLSGAADAALAEFGFRDLRGDPVASGVLAIVVSLSRMRPVAGSEEARRLEEVLIAQLQAIILAAQLRRDAGDAIVGELFGRLRALLWAEPGGELSTWARALGCSTTVLSTALAAQGWAPKALVTETRLLRFAAALRDEGPEPAEEIVTALGFAGLPQATRAFRRRFGISPRRYRLLNRP
ncbi:AraC family transcriptional regulator [Microbacteriaceae bacterium VKM Ac-2854]|nr:AraC family transcriptional regulator [Microbacteriaceae bacterium VKM Ac-2854]